MLSTKLSEFLRGKFESLSEPERQEFKRYKLLRSSRVHLFQFDSVDTTMRLADEFTSRATAYTEKLADLDDRSSQTFGAALAFQADH